MISLALAECLLLCVKIPGHCLEHCIVLLAAQGGGGLIPGSWVCTGDSAGQYAPPLSSFDAIGQNFLAEAMRLESSTGNDESEDAFEKLLQEMMNMRSMLQNLSGEDRRKAAGDMMLRMQEQLGLSDGESSEED